VLALKALLQTVRGGESARANITVTLNETQTRTVQVTPDNFGAVQVVTFDEFNVGQENRVEIVMEGQGSLAYAVASSFYLPWERLRLHPELAPAADQLTLEVKYDRTELRVNDSLQVEGTVSLNQPGAHAQSVVIDLGLPPGFSVQTDDLDALVTQHRQAGADGARIERYELTGRQIMLYATNLREGQPLSFSYRLTARFPVSVRAPGSLAYDCYNPDISGSAAPERLIAW